jgi:hypothetical protein
MIYRGRKVALGLTKKWKKYMPINGQVREHISPYQQKIFAGLFSNWRQKTLKRFTDNALVVGVPAAAYVGAMTWTDSKFHQLAVEHRD